MSDLADLKNKNASSKKHEEINKIIDEIKELENNFVKFDLSKPEVEKDLIEIDYEKFETVEEPKIDISPKKKEKIKKIKKQKIKEKKPKIKKTISKPLNPATFKLRYNDRGKLENIDIKKPKSKPKTKEKSNKRFKFRRGEKKEENKEKSSIGKKLTKGISKLGKLKKVIPSKKKSSEEPNEKTESETDT